MTSLGALVGGTSSSATGVSADGSVIVGASNYAGTLYNYHPFKYTNGTMTDLGTLGGASSKAYAVSADGSVIVGESYTSGNSRLEAFKYSNGIMTALGNLGGTSGVNNASATGVSADGSVIVGQSWINNSSYHAFKYINGTMTDLGTLGGAISAATGVSADGSVIVGYSKTIDPTYSNNNIAFKYSNGTMTSLGTLGGVYSVAYAVSADGSVIVGQSFLTGATNNIAFKYVNGTMTSLGTLGGTTSTALGVSADGKVIVGRSSTASNQTHAFVYGAWANGGLVDVPNTYSSIVANGYQLNAILNAQNTLLAIGLNSDCNLYGENDVCVSAGGRYTNVSNPTASQTATNIQVAYRFNPKLRAGVFLDQGISNTNPNNYSVKNPQPLAGLFAVYAPSGTNLGWQVKASVAYSNNDVNITRTTLANTEAGQGTAAMTTQGGQLETAYGLALDNGWIASPFAGIRSTRVSRDSYTETAGATFPITYNAVNQSATTAYGGAKVMGYVTSNISVGASAGVEQDMSSNISNNSGSIYYLGAYSLDAPTIRQTRAVVAANADYWIEKNQRVSFSAYYNQQSLNSTDGITVMLYYTVGL
jgi:probable HAF family extracellular repeat protein